MRTMLYRCVVRLYRAIARRLDGVAHALGGHDYSEAEPSPSGKSGYRCRHCSHYSNASVRALYAACPGKVKP